MAVPKDKIYVSDSYPVSYKVRKVNPDDPSDPLGEPATIIDAYARVLQADAVPDPVFLELGGPGVFQVSAVIQDDMIYWTLDTAFTSEPGNYRVYITAVFPGTPEITQTANRNLKVLDTSF